MPIRPDVGLLGVVVGTFGAIATVPPDITSPDSLFWPALILSLGLAAGPAAAALNDPRAFFRVENIIGLSPVFWLLLEPLQGATNIRGRAGPEHVTTVFLAIGLFMGGMWLACLFPRWNIPAGFRRSLTVDVNSHVLFSVAVAAFCLGMLPYAIPCHFSIPTMLYYLGEMRWAAPWGRGFLGGWDAFLYHLCYFGYLLPTLAVLLARKIGWMHPRTLLVLAMALIMSLFLMQTGGRRVIGVVVGSAILAYVLGEHRHRLRTFALGMVALVGLLWVISMMLEYRNVGFSVVFDTEEAGQSTPPEMQHYFVDNNISSFANLVYFIPKKHPHVYHRYFVWVLIRPVPRVFWAGKPVDPGFNLPEAMRAGNISLSVTLIGEFYMAAGLLMVPLGGWLYGRFAGMASTLLESSRKNGSLLSYSIVALALFAGMRSGINLVLMLYPLLAWGGLLWLIRATGLSRAGHLPQPVTRR